MIAIIALPGRALAVDDTTELYVDAEIYNNHLLCVQTDGRLVAWDLTGLKYDTALSSAMSGRKLSHVARGGNALWAYIDKQIHRWSPESARWELLWSVKSKGEPLIDLVSVEGVPIAVFPTVVVDPSSDHRFKVPELEGQIRGLRALRALALFVTGPLVWVGTGQGEWGGHLVGLNVKTGAWTQYYDPLNYVTGITEGPEGTLMVSWAMSHFEARTMVREHDKTGAVEKEGPVLRSRYIQAIAYSSYDGLMYAVEQNSLVTINQGEPRSHADLGRLPYRREPHAIGVAPSVLSLIPNPIGGVIVVHRNALPFIYTDQKLRSFEEPPLAHRVPDN